MRISHEAISRAIYVLPRGALSTTLMQALRQARAYRRTRKSQDHEETRGTLVAMRSIEERPHDVADRTMPGHWEGDLILGKHQRTAARHLGGTYDAVYLAGPAQSKRCDLGAERLCHSVGTRHQ